MGGSCAIINICDFRFPFRLAVAGRMRLWSIPLISSWNEFNRRHRCSLKGCSTNKLLTSGRYWSLQRISLTKHRCLVNGSAHDRNEFHRKSSISSGPLADFHFPRNVQCALNRELNVRHSEFRALCNTIDGVTHAIVMLRRVCQLPTFEEKHRFGADQKAVEKRKIKRKKKRCGAPWPVDEQLIWVTMSRLTVIVNAIYSFGSFAPAQSDRRIRCPTQWMMGCWAIGHSVMNQIACFFLSFIRSVGPLDDEKFTDASRRTQVKSSTRNVLCLLSMVGRLVRNRPNQWAFIESAVGSTTIDRKPSINRMLSPSFEASHTILASRVHSLGSSQFT